MPVTGTLAAVSVRYRAVSRPSLFGDLHDTREKRKLGWGVLGSS